MSHLSAGARRVLLDTGSFMNLRRYSIAQWLLATALIAAAGLVGCAETDPPGGSDVGHPPTIVSTLPADGTIGAATNASIAVVFDMPMNPFDSDHFGLRFDQTDVAGVINTSADGLTITFAPEADLAPETSFEGFVLAGARSVNGAGLAENFRWNFTTGTEADLDPPHVVSTAPPNGMTGVAINQALSVTFSENMDPTSISVAEFTLMQGETPIAGTVLYAGVNAMFTPNEMLEPSTEYLAQIGTGVADLAGNTMVEDYTWTFTTGTSADVVAPTVVSNTPAALAIDVPRNQRISVTFSEPMAPNTISAATLTLRAGSTPVVATVTYTGITAVLAPWELLEANTEYTVTLSTVASDLAGNRIESAHEWRFSTGTESDTTPPTIVLTVPDDNEDEVRLNQTVSAVFSEPLDPATVNATSMALMDGIIPVTGVVTYANATATFTPNAQLAENTVYSVIIGTGITDLAGNPLEDVYGWSFVTVVAADTIAPTVVSNTPVNAATDVPRNQRISITFSEPMAPTSISAATFTLRSGSTPVTATVTYAGVTAVLAPWDLLASNTEYTVTMSTVAADLAGNRMESTHEWRFTTGTESDTTAPMVLSTVPINNAVDVAFDQNVSAVFNEALDTATVNTTTMTLMQGITPVTGIVSYADGTATFNPVNDLAASTVYSVLISTGVTDLAGNPLENAFGWSFTTAVAPDTLAPTVVSNVPAAAATDVPRNQRMSVTFSEPMAPTTISAATLTLRAGSTPVVATVTYSGVTAVLAPWELLDADTEYTATLSTVAADLAGNRMESEHEWRFTTGVAVDTTAPMVLTTIPANNALAVELDQVIAAVFNEPLDPASVNASTMTLMLATTPVSGTVSYANGTATFTPSSSLMEGGVYHVMLSTEVTDLAGNPLASPYGWIFTTVDTVEAIAPTVLSTTPHASASGVPLNQRVSITFSEPMAPATISAATLTLRAGSAPIISTVTYSGTSAFLTPWELLQESTEYTVTLSTDATDLAGNTIESEFEWRFTTGTTSETIPPTVSSTIPINNAVFVDIGQNISAMFSEPLDPATVTTTTMTVTSASVPVSGTVTYSGVTATFHPAANLVADALYDVSISTGVTDLVGNPMANPYHWRFTAGETHETIPPTIISTTPGFAATNVPINQAMSITFSEAMASSSITSASFTLRRGAAPIVSTVTYHGVTALLTPWEPLAYNTEYTATLSTDAVDLAGNPIASAHEWRFTTQHSPDTTAPTVVSTTPLAGVIDAEIDVHATITFSEAMAPATLNTNTLTMRRGTVPIPATVTYAGVVATLIPWEVLAYETEYTVTLSVGATDLAGNPLQSAHEWRFTTRVEPDTIPPTVVSTLPVDGANDVEIDQAVSVVFSEALNPATVTNASFTLHQGATPVAAAVTYAGVTAVLTPSAPLQYETTYSVALGTTIADPSGNQLVHANTFEFTTRIAPDIIPPHLVSASPSAGATGAATDAGVVITFSEAMAPASVTTSSILVIDAGLSPVPGSVSLDATGTVATFLPAADFARGATFSVALSTALTDLAGNPLNEASEWLFTTAAGPAPVSLQTAGDYIILARTGITTTGVSDVTGDLGLSPGVDAVLLGWGQSAATTFSTSPMVDGRIYVSTYAAPTPANLITASNDMGAAYSAVAAQGPPNETDLNAGALGGVTFAPGIYRWGAAATIATDVTMHGGPNDVFVFQVNGALAMAASVSVVLTGGARPENVFWQVNGAINIGATSHFAGIALASTAINVGAGSTVNGRLLAQTAVSVDTCEIAITAP